MGVRCCIHNIMEGAMTNPSTLRKRGAQEAPNSIRRSSTHGGQGQRASFWKVSQHIYYFWQSNDSSAFSLVSFSCLEDNAVLYKKIVSTFTTLFVSLWIGVRRYQNPSFGRPEPPRVVGVWQRLRRIERFRHPITAPIARLQRKFRPRYTRPREEWQRTLPNPNLEGWTDSANNCRRPC
jgi:hypothetical protein